MSAQPTEPLLFGSLDGDTAAKLAIVADPEHPVGRDVVRAFLAACEADAKAHDGRVSVSRVSAALPDDITRTERYAALWSAFTGNGKPMRRVKTDDGRTVYDIREGSRSGNDGKPTIAREWVAPTTNPEHRRVERNGRVVCSCGDYNCASLDYAP